MKKLILSLVLAALVSVNAFASDATLIDVRTLKEWNASHLNGAIHVPLQNIKSKITSVIKDRNTKIFLYCRSGRRSEEAKEIMRSLGYTDITNSGGIKEAANILKIKIIIKNKD